MDDEPVKKYEPLPRWGQLSVSYGNKVYMWGGRTEDFSEDKKKKLSSSVEIFDCKTETWATRHTTGTPPKGLYNSSYALQGSCLYVYGGWDGQKAHNALHMLNLKTLAWSVVKVENPDEAPPEMSGCGLVAFGNRKLVLFGGYGEMKKKEKVKSDDKNAAEMATTEEIGAECVENGTGDKGSVTGNGSLDAAVNGCSGEEEVTNVTAESVATESGGGKKLQDEGGVGESGGEDGEGGAEDGGATEGGAEDGGATEGGGKDGGATEGGGKDGGEEQKKEGTENGISGDMLGTSNESNGGTSTVVNGESEEERKAEQVTKLTKVVSFKLPSESRDTPMLVAAEAIDATNTQNGERDGVGEEEVREGKEEEEEVNASFDIYKRNETDKKGWTNEVKVFDLDTGLWTSQQTTGCVPPPCVDFSFTCVDEKRAVVFGGYQPQTGITSDTFLLDMDTWVWTKLSGPSESPPSPSQPTPSILLHPSARDGHAACVIEGGPRPLMLVTGGWDAMDHALNDMWLLDVNSGIWSQLTAEGVGYRFWHTTVMSHSSSRMRQLLTFGGCPGAPESHTTGSWPKMAASFLMEIGKIPCLPTQSTGSAGTEEGWVVVDAVSLDQLGDPTRRMQEKALLTSFCMQRAEEMIHELTKNIHELTKKIERGVAASAPKPQVKKSILKQVVKEEEEEVKEEVKKEVKEAKVEVKLPFWQKSMSEIQMTYEEIGRGRFSIVRVAIFHETRVAVRCLNNRIVSEENRKVFTGCLEKAAQLRHPNLVSFMGAILDREPVIITELMPCNLRFVLEKNALTYYQLVDVALCVSKALEYLHSTKPEPVIHGELTGTSVLLEGHKGPRLKAKLSDYMTAKYFHHLVSSMTPASSTESVFVANREHPSQEYKPRRRSRSSSPFDVGKPRGSPERPHFRRKSSNVSSAPLDVGMFSTKRDVYLFGILLVEMATRTAVLEVSLQYLIESIAWPQVTALVKKCLNHEPDLRPDINSVLSQVMQLASSKP